MRSVIIPSVSIADKPSHCCITNNEWGYGVFSWHINIHDAQHNAKVTGGICMPVDYVDGELVVPSLAHSIISKKFGL